MKKTIMYTILVLLILPFFLPRPVTKAEYEKDGAELSLTLYFGWIGLMFMTWGYQFRIFTENRAGKNDLTIKGEKREKKVLDNQDQLLKTPDLIMINGEYQEDLLKKHDIEWLLHGDNRNRRR